MEPFLEQGQLAGKIMCPNKKCNAKLGSYDWAGVCCSCKEWVVPVSPNHPPTRAMILTSTLGILHPQIEGR